MSHRGFWHTLDILDVFAQSMDIYKKKISMDILVDVSAWVYMNMFVILASVQVKAKRGFWMILGFLASSLETRNILVETNHNHSFNTFIRM